MEPHSHPLPNKCYGLSFQIFYSLVFSCNIRFVPWDPWELGGGGGDFTIILIIILTKTIVITMIPTIASMYWALTLWQTILRCGLCLHYLIESFQQPSRIGSVWSIFRCGKEDKERERRLRYLDGAIYLSIPRTLNNHYLNGDPWRPVS